MARTPNVSTKLAQKFATSKDTPYLRFVRRGGARIISDALCADLRTVERKAWAGAAQRRVHQIHEAFPRT